jgi:hypothetical protein
MTMDQIMQKKDGSNNVGHILRVAVMFLSFGFIFPHAMTENEEIAKSKPTGERKAQAR